MKGARKNSTKWASQWILLTPGRGFILSYVFSCFFVVVAVVVFVFYRKRTGKTKAKRLVFHDRILSLRCVSRSWCSLTSKSLSCLSDLGWLCVLLLGVFQTYSLNIGTRDIPVQPHWCPFILLMRSNYRTFPGWTRLVCVSFVIFIRKDFTCIFRLAERPASKSPTTISL